MTPSDPFAYVRTWNNTLATKGWWHSFELPDGTTIEGVCDLPGLRHRIAQFPIPADLHGKRVLDIGAWDGWFSFEMERRGAAVVAIDCWENPRFQEMHALLGSRVEYRQMDVYDLSPERVGRFDVVLFMGVLYHLKHPLLALERVCSVTEGLAAVDSFILKEEHRPHEDLAHRSLMQFYETDEFGGQTDNWIGPTLPCLSALCRTAGFARVNVQCILPESACLACYRHWEPPPDTPSTAPLLLDAFHHTTFGINFTSHKDDYVSSWFETSSSNVSIATVQPEVGEYGIRPIKVIALDHGRWQANFKLPPGLSSGWQEVRVRVGNSARSNAHLIAVDIPVTTSGLHITGIADGRSWTPNRLDLKLSTSLAVWLVGLPANADKTNVKVYLQGRRLALTYVERPTSDNTARQLNVQVPETTGSGALSLWVEVGPHTSNIELVDVAN